MVKKFKLEAQYDDGYTIFGISSTFQDYRLLFHLNKFLDATFERIDDFSPALEKGTNLSFPLFYWENNVNCTKFFLLANKHPGNRIPMLPDFKHVDYFLLADHAVDENSQQRVFQLKEAKAAQAVFVIDLNRIKNHSLIISELELHLMEVKKKP